MVADRHNAKLFNIYVHIVYMYCDWYDSFEEKYEFSRFFYS